jgi:hypothetical protein
MPDTRHTPNIGLGVEPFVLASDVIRITIYSGLCRD